MIPLYHDFSEETVLVFGGGTVATRKARRFATEARVVVVSPAFTDDLRELASAADGGVELIREAPAADAIGDWTDRVAPALVVVATDDATVNAAAEAAARERGVLVNRADESGGRDVGSVVVPATVEQGSVSVALSTGGRSPALSKVLRQRIEAEIEGAGTMADLTAEVRADLKDAGVDPGTRRDAVRAVVRSEAVWKALQAGDANAKDEANRVVQETCKE